MFSKRNVTLSLGSENCTFITYPKGPAFKSNSGSDIVTARKMSKNGIEPQLYVIKPAADEYEASAVSTLIHSTISDDKIYKPQLYNDKSGNDFIVYPYIKGERLDKYIEQIKGQPHAFKKIIEIFIDICKTASIIEQYNEKTNAFDQLTGIWDFRLDNMIVQTNDKGENHVVFFDYHAMRTNPHVNLEYMLQTSLYKLCSEQKKEMNTPALTEILKDKVFDTISSETKNGLIKFMQSNESFRLKSTELAQLLPIEKKPEHRMG